MKTIKKINPGKKGTKRLVEQYGDNLVCVRYRHDYERQRKIKTIELIIDEKPLNNKPSKIPMNKIMQLHVKYGEVHIGKLIRSADGCWNRNKKVWELPYREVLALGLQDRIVEQGEKSA